MNILVVDDDPLTLEVLRKGLENHGHQVTTGEDGYKALCLLEEKNFDFVICDIFMPQLSGLVVANIINHYYGSSVPLLLMSSNKNVGLFVRSHVNPAYDFMEKPISITELVLKIDLMSKRIPVSAPMPVYQNPSVSG